MRADSFTVKCFRNKTPYGDRTTRNTSSLVTYTMARSLDCLTYYEDYERAVKDGADVNAVDTWDGSTPLFTVSEFNMYNSIDNYREIIKLFVAHGADVNHTDNEGYTALFTSDSDLYSRALLEHGATAEITLSSGVVASAMVEAAVSSYVHTINYLVKTRHVDVNKVIDQKKGRAVLHMACAQLGRVAGDSYMLGAKGVEKLIMCGAVVDARDRKGSTPLHTARWNWRCAEALILAGADVNVTIPSPSGALGLLHGASFMSFRILHMLLTYGADVNMVSGDGDTPVTRLLKSSSVSTDVLRRKFDLLMDHGARCSITNADGVGVSDTIMGGLQYFAVRIQERLRDERWERRGSLILARHESEKGVDSHAKVTKIDDDAQGAYNKMLDWVVRFTPDGVFRNVVEYL